MTTKLLAISATAAALMLSGCGEEKSAGISPQQFTDALHLVMDSDRAVYTKKVVGRLAKQEQVIKASEHFMDDKALPLPAQMFRFGAETVAGKTDKFSYSLQSLWPINSQNSPVTEAEKAGLQFIIDNPGQNYYGEETLGGVTYFTAVYPDVAVAPVCASCHNEHKDSPRTDFKVGDVMGGVVIRVPI
ncbi:MULTISPECIES: Tll0287-like domain-containing protein [Corallincola]|uniref:DUF3365 domain-containing protein n=3 Tax=Corallincola TaxID=1775176 RepID=A0A368NLQ9_9GAMM|nr:MULTISPECIES: DUF3365 domain-containing protein [Corallincola]RCU51527.1 DUF3365 domain-containing protein [Corallincola holothuriorum]TAA47029.1 DUF3365 domain-containing protein [Corallincola spongiicola]TCI04683.1 DUF3365 domain-containing protein [Corallincola luteus]